MSASRLLSINHRLRSRGLAWSPFSEVAKCQIQSTITIWADWTRTTSRTHQHTISQRSLLLLAAWNVFLAAASLAASSISSSLFHSSSLSSSLLRRWYTSDSIYWNILNFSRWSCQSHPETSSMNVISMIILRHVLQTRIMLMMVKSQCSRPEETSYLYLHDRTLRTRSLSVHGPSILYWRSDRSTLIGNISLVPPTFLKNCSKIITSISVGRSHIVRLRRYGRAVLGLFMFAMTRLASLREGTWVSFWWVVRGRLVSIFSGAAVFKFALSCWDMLHWQEISRSLKSSRRLIDTDATRLRIHLLRARLHLAFAKEYVT